VAGRFGGDLWLVTLLAIFNLDFRSAASELQTHGEHGDARSAYAASITICRTSEGIFARSNGRDCPSTLIEDFHLIDE